MTEQEATDFVAWLRTRRPTTIAVIREFYAADGTFAGRYVELRGRSGRTQLWNSKAEFVGANTIWLGGWTPALIIGIGAFLLGTGEARSVIAGGLCLGLGALWVTRLFRLR
jgi:hypothetical protein